MSKYLVIGVRTDGTVVESKNRFNTPPSEAFLCSWGVNRRCDAVIRYFPSLKGWRVLDIREARQVQPRSNGRGGSFTQWHGQKRCKVYPNEDAAVMACMVILNRQLDLAI